MGKGYKNINKVKQKIISMNSQFKKLETDMKNLRSALDTMMKGDADGPYWNGEAAQVFYTQGVKNYKNNITEYNNAFKKIDSLAGAYEEDVINNKNKKGKK